MIGRTLCRSVLLSVWLGGLNLASPCLSLAADRASFDRDIRPILSSNCFPCHGPDGAAREADLRLDQRELAIESGAIVPGDVDASEALRRIRSADPSEQMPPPESKKQLTEVEKDIIEDWIRSGAEYESHWSFIPPQRASLPPELAHAPLHEVIDHFVSQRLQQEGLEFSPPADRRTLIRRLSFDLTGLPPTAEEVKAFIADDRPDAYERLVDRLLASPHYGERMALDWLDAARYADTNGYSIDGGRHMWLWRDWVIHAFNSNLPYDEFLVEQLAGDLLPDRTDSQLIASGFQRNNMVTHEGGTIPEENLTNYNVDRVKTLGEAILGLTLGCAQCHDHKYDPISQREFYQFYAYFNTLSDVGLDGDGGRNPRPFFEARTVLRTDEEPLLRRRIAQLRSELKNLSDEAVSRWEHGQREALEIRGRNLELLPLKLTKVSTPNSGDGFGIEEQRFVRITKPPGMVAYDVSTELPTTDKPITGVRLVFHPDDHAPGNGWGFGSLVEPANEVSSTAATADGPKRGTFVLTSFSASTDVVASDQVNLHRMIEVDHVTASSWDDRYWPENVLDTRNENGWSPSATSDGAVHITATFKEPIDAVATPHLTVQMNFGHGRALIAGKIELFALTGDDDGSPLPSDVIAILETPREQRSTEAQQRLRSHFAFHSADTKASRIDLANLEERLAVLTQKFSTMIMDEAKTPRKTYILNRGDYAQPTEVVEPGVPSALPPLPDGAPHNRLGLARWVTMPGHPLTARVAVNRFWQMLFGHGLVRTTADFGAQGEYPTHPELLDALAVDFVESGWDVKSLVKQIVMSSTYRQSSSASDELLARDPTNHWLARGPRFRLPAEFIRDAALQMSGLLVARIGGPSVNPYAPGDLWREISHYGSSPATAQTFVQDHGEKLYRRSLYTYWKRTSPPPNMTVFDAPNRETCVVARPVTTTPLQALVLLNDVQFVEAARAFAERIVAASDNDDERLQWAFEEAVSRPPSDAEIAILREALDRERAHYRADEHAAREFLSAGESPRDSSIPLAEHAAWSQIASLIINLSETVTRN